MRDVINRPPLEIHNRLSSWDVIRRRDGSAPRRRTWIRWTIPWIIGNVFSTTTLRLQSPPSTSKNLRCKKCFGNCKNIFPESIRMESNWIRYRFDWNFYKCKMLPFIPIELRLICLQTMPVVVKHVSNLRRPGNNSLNSWKTNVLCVTTFHLILYEMIQLIF